MFLCDLDKSCSSIFSACIEETPRDAATLFIIMPLVLPVEGSLLIDPYAQSDLANERQSLCWFPEVFAHILVDTVVTTVHLILRLYILIIISNPTCGIYG
jgi:hypothetical protein